MEVLKFNNAGRLAFNKGKYEGTTHQTEFCGEVEILKYEGANKVLVRFEDGQERYFQLRKILKGNIRNPYHPHYKLLGVGVCDISTKGFEKEYSAWSNLIRRTSGMVKTTAYVNATCSDDWKVFSSFLRDLKLMKGYSTFLNNDWALDKDLIVFGNKHYSKDTCVLVPREINNLLVRKESSNIGCKVGVHWSSKKEMYVAQLSVKTRRLYIGAFRNEEEAFQAYKKAKETYIKEVAEKWKVEIDDRVYNTLMSWELIE